MSTLDYYKQAFNSVGWFIPPYVAMGFLGALAKKINDNGKALDQQELEEILALIYSPENLATMVTERYPITPYVQDYKVIVSEAVEAHFMGLHHIAVAGLIPVIEGAGKKLADSRNVPFKSITSVFLNLATDCKNDSINNNIGAVGEIVSMMDSFIEFTDKHLYIDSSNYQLTDKTNRHGILHGKYSDNDYGDPINFYKSIAAVDFLCFISAFRASISWFAPAPTEFSNSLASYYYACINVRGSKP
jgi:hypothetical protein